MAVWSAELHPMAGTWPWGIRSCAPEHRSRLRAQHPRPTILRLSVLPSTPKARPGSSAPGVSLAAAATQEVAQH